MTWIQIDSVDGGYWVSQQQSLSENADSPVARKLVPKPTKKLNSNGTAKLALTSILHPSMRVEAIVTLLHVSAGSVSHD